MKRISIVGVALGLLSASVASAQRAPRFVIVGTESNPIVADSVTKLEWQGCIAGKEGVGCAIGVPTKACEATTSAGEPEKCSWKEALAYCEKLSWGGQGKWRLPNVKELQSIADYRGEPNAFFPETPSGSFWSSSSDADNTACRAWAVSFDGSVAFPGNKGFPSLVRCVRAEP